MVLGTGVDIIKLQRVNGLIESGDLRFLERIFTKSELEQAKNRQDTVAYFASRFAAKEAVFKTFSTNWENEIQMNEIDIIDGEFGQPIVKLTGKFAELASKRNVKEVMISLSYDTDYAIAFAILIGND